MTSLPYSKAFHPPAPLLSVSLRHPNGLGQPLLLEAQIDTGANRTVVPMSVAVRLGLDRVTQLQFVVVGGVITLPVY